MAPKKKPNKRMSTTVTSKKLVEETLQVVVTPVAEEKGKDKKKRKNKKRAKAGGYGRYIYLVMKQVLPDMGISSKAMTILEDLIGDMFHRIAETAATLLKYTGRVTLSSRDIHGAVNMVLPGQLAKHAISEGTKSVICYATHVDGQDKSKIM